MWTPTTPVVSKARPRSHSKYLQHVIKSSGYLTTETWLYLREVIFSFDLLYSSVTTPNFEERYFFVLLLCFSCWTLLNSTCFLLLKCNCRKYYVVIEDLLQTFINFINFSFKVQSFRTSVLLLEVFCLNEFRKTLSWWVLAHEGFCTID